MGGAHRDGLVCEEETERDRHVGVLSLAGGTRWQMFDVRCSPSTVWIRLGAVAATSGGWLGPSPLLSTHQEKAQNQRNNPIVWLHNTTH